MIGKILVIVGAGLGAGLVAGHFGLLDGPEARRARKELGAAFRRLPLPHLQLHLPTSLEELEGLDDALCECSTLGGAVQGMSTNEFLALLPEIQACTAGLLFPDIDWPPVHSDSPTIHQYWAILDQRYRRLVYSGELAQFCRFGQIPSSAQLDDDAAEPGFYDTVVPNGPASFVHYPGALVDVRHQQE